MKYQNYWHNHPLRLAEEAAQAKSRFWRDLGETLMAFLILAALPLTVPADRIWVDMRKPKEDRQ